MHLHASLHIWSCACLAVSQTPLFVTPNSASTESNPTPMARIGNGFSFILNFRLPDVQLVIGWSVAEVGYKIRWFTFPAAPILRHHPWTSYGQNDFLYSNGVLIFSLAFTYYMHIDGSSNFFIFPKQKRPAILGFVSCTFGRMQIGWILHKVCSFVGTGWAHHHVVLWW